MGDQGPHPIGRHGEYFAGFHDFGGVEGRLTFEIAQLAEEPPWAMHADHLPIARVVGGDDRNLAGKNDDYERNETERHQ